MNDLHEILKMFKIFTFQSQHTRLVVIEGDLSRGQLHFPPRHVPGHHGPGKPFLRGIQLRLGIFQNVVIDQYHNDALSLSLL